MHIGTYVGEVMGLLSQQKKNVCPFNTEFKRWHLSVLYSINGDTKLFFKSLWIVILSYRW